MSKGRRDLSIGIIITTILICIYAFPVKGEEAPKESVKKEKTVEKSSQSKERNAKSTKRKSREKKSPVKTKKSSVSKGETASASQKNRSEKDKKNSSTRRKKRTAAVDSKPQKSTTKEGSTPEVKSSDTIKKSSVSKEKTVRTTQGKSSKKDNITSSTRRKKRAAAVDSKPQNKTSKESSSKEMKSSDKIIKSNVSKENNATQAQVEKTSLKDEKVKSKPKVKSSGTHICFGAGLHAGLHRGGVQSRFWYNDVIGLEISGYGEYTPKGAGCEMDFLYKAPVSSLVKPYIAIGGGYHLQKIDTTFNTIPYSKWIDAGIFYVAAGAEARLGKHEKHGISLEVGYQMGEAEYTHTSNAIGSSDIIFDTSTYDLSRVVASLAYTYYFCKPKPVDSDGDGIFNDFDKCPTVAEDRDNYLDSDGCPDLDNDNDGVLDSVDKCPDVSEDFDQIDDEDGCPDFDNDKDGVVDSLDQCPKEAEDKDHFEDEDGCPDVDNDKDGIPDSYDQCPDKAEDLDQYEDIDGCPELDNDLDGFLDMHDKCPNEAETRNQYMDEDGCADTVFEITAAQMILRGVYFKGGSDQLKSESFPVLDDVVKSLKIWPSVRLEVQGHTDAIGNPKANKLLSLQRARAVRRYFISQGIDKSRLTAVGYGKEKPIAHNSSAAGRAKNRRVELKRID